MALVNNTGVFGTATRSNTLLAIHLLGETHASELAALLGRSLSRVQSAIESLERTGLVVGLEEGNTRRVRLNQRFPAIKELDILLSALGKADIELQRKLAAKRRRPRKRGKAL